MEYSENNNNRKRKGYRSRKKKVRNKAGVIIFRVILAVVLISCFAVGGAAVGAYMGIIQNAPNLDIISIKPSIYPSIIYYEDGTESDRLKGEENREYVTFDKIPQNLKDAFVAIEDERFYNHNGIDLKGMVRALYKNLTTNRTEGASTITQQLIKNNVRKIGRNDIITKLQEQYLAVEYEKKLTAQFGGSKPAAKDHILELYMNSINMHYSLNGVQTASEYYFSKPVSDLSLSECAVIAAITQNPAHNAPIANPEKNRSRQILILDKMLELEMITQEEHDQAMDDDVYARVSTQAKVIEENNSVHSYFNDALMIAVANDLQEKYSIGRAEAFNWLYNAGLSIYSTQDPAMQAIMDDSFSQDSFFPKGDFAIDVQYTVSIHNGITDKVEHFYKQGTVKNKDGVDGLVEGFRNELLGASDSIVPNSEKVIQIPQPQAAMVITDYRTGQVKALTGGRGEKMANLALNRATDSERQPGSVFKVLASYAPSLDLGVSTAATLLDDAPYTYQGYSPKNWYGGYRGWSTVRDGITNSMNVITVKNMVNTGIDECFKYLLNFGFTTLAEREEINGKIYSDKAPATCLGGLTHGVTQLEVASAYGTIANLGEYIKPVLYTRVLDHDNNVLLENIPEPKQVLKKQTAYILTDMMKDVITRGTGGQARFRNIRMPLSGKTGTTTDTVDLTFVGYTPYYVGSIWLGYDMPKAMWEDKGYHMMLWRDVMEKIHADLPVIEFERPDGVVTATICGVSGQLPGATCKAAGTVRSDYFVAGTQPNTYCDGSLHVSEAPVPGPGEVLYEDPTTGETYILPAPDLDNLDGLPIFTDPPTVDGTLTNPTTTPQPTPNQLPSVTVPPTIPTPTPVPEYVPNPQPAPEQPPAGENVSPALPDLPTMDEPQSMDSFTY